MRFAVYGSLRRSMPNDHLWSPVGFSVPCEIPGVALYDVGGPFPYAIVGTDRDVTVGDLVTVEDPDNADAVLKRLDILEGVDNDHFRRHQWTVRLHGGDWVTAELYLAHPNLKPDIKAAGHPIAHGDWVRHLHAHLTTH